jgi:hypothetical protein
MVGIKVEAFKPHQGAMVGIGTLADGRRVAFAPDRATYIMAAPLLPVVVDVADWRIIATREV